MKAFQSNANQLPTSRYGRERGPEVNKLEQVHGIGGGGVHVVGHMPHPPPGTELWTDRTENITLPETTYVCGKKHREKLRAQRKHREFHLSQSGHLVAVL